VPDAPVWIGSGLAFDEASEGLLRVADGAIVGSALYATTEAGARWVDATRVARMRESFERARTAR